MTFPFCPQHNFYQPSGAGDSYRVMDQRYVIVFDPPGGAFSGFTITMPPNPYDNHRISFTATATISGVVLRGSPGQGFGANTSMTSISPTGAGQNFIYRASAATWYQMP